MILCDHLPWALMVPRNLLEDRQRHHGGSGRKLHGKAGRELSRTVRWIKTVIYNPALVPTLSLCFACFRIPQEPQIPPLLNITRMFCSQPFHLQRVVGKSDI